MSYEGDLEEDTYSSVYELEYPCCQVLCLHFNFVKELGLTFVDSPRLSGIMHGRTRSLLS